MSSVTTITMRVVVGLVAVYLVVLLLAHSIFVYTRMGGDSMSPLIRSNDFVVGTRLFHTSSLHDGDLVIANIPTPGGAIIHTVRKIEQQRDTPVGQFYLLGVATNAVDSRWLGAFPARDIQAKVIWIIKRS
jgi:signal peptidase I